MIWLRYLSAFVVAVLIAAVIASLIATQFVLAEYTKLDIVISASDRLYMSVADLGILETFLPAIGVCFLIAFLLASLIHNRLPLSRKQWFVVAGFSGWICTFLIIEMVLGFQAVAGVRGTTALLFQGIAGAIGGWTFATLSQSHQGQGS